LVKGIGPILAKKLVGRLGAEVVAVIENRVAELQSVDGIGPKRRARIAHAWQHYTEINESYVKAGKFTAEESRELFRGMQSGN
jgi:exodeoxyribonuclease V alpha subunit